MTRNLMIAAAMTTLTIASSVDAGGCPLSNRGGYLPPARPIRFAEPLRHTVSIGPVSISARVAHRPAPAFGAFSRVNELACELEQLTSEFCLDLYYNYSHNPGFRETYTEAYHIFEVAQYLGTLGHPCDREAVRAQVCGLDAQLHQIECSVVGWTRAPRQQVGCIGIANKLDRIDETLHCLMEDVGAHPTPILDTPPAPGVVLGTVPPNPAGF